MKSSFCSEDTIKKYLVEDYCEAVGLTNIQITKQKVDAAVRHMHKILLCDLNPPWVNHQFPQALPGEGILSRFTRPSFLQRRNLDLFLAIQRGSRSEHVSGKLRQCLRQQSFFRSSNDRSSKNSS